MKKKRSENKTLCLHFCAYYKPGKNEELACCGYEVVDSLIRNGRIAVPATSDRTFDRARAELLVQNMCVHCDFERDACDFMLDRNTPPCGGFILLARLIEAGTIMIEDVVERSEGISLK